jgi:hypothetical protein
MVIACDSEVSVRSSWGAILENFVVRMDARSNLGSNTVISSR